MRRQTMFEKVREHLDEIVSIAGKCPEQYQVKCFEILLSALVKTETPPVRVVERESEITARERVMPQADFLSRHGLTEQEWSRVFDFDGSSWSIIAKLKDKKVSKKQIQLALLLGAKSLLEGTEPIIPKSSLVELCKHYATYDVKNFAHHMKKAQQNLFLRRGDDWSLTRPGQEKAAGVIKELAQ
jgi:hypothetical protein